VFQFSTEERKKFRDSAEERGMTGYLKDRCKDTLTRKLQIPHSGTANWSQYYYCPTCSVPLVFDLDKPYEHLCPSCKKNFCGGVYDGAWTKLLNVCNIDGAYHLGLLYLCTGDLSYAQRAKEILSAYALYYPDYAVHGDIPYNGPGKANAQTLDEAIFLRTLASAYDLVEETLDEREKSFIKDRLFKEGLAFLRQHRHNQLHNHEVICNGAIGILGLLLNDKAALNFALHTKYGLLYQLEQGVLEDGFWFEGSTAYHFFALQNFLAFEKFARYTAYSNLNHPNYRKMIHSSLALLKEDLSFPLLNDTHLHQGQPNGYGLFEFAYKTWKEPLLLGLLNKIYTKQPRLSVESFFYGEEVLEIAPPLVFENLHETKGLGVSILRDSNEQYLLFRHGQFGGEHDHHDRLGISYSYLGQPVSEDLGTTGYGARLHYGYYKHTGTHNTVVIDEENQSPSKAEVLAYEQDSSHCLVDAQVTFCEHYPLPDSFTIKQWSTEAYQGVTMRRRLYKREDYLVDLFEVTGVEKGKNIDFVMHFGGKRLATSVKGESIPFFSPKEPFSHLHDISFVLGNQQLETNYQVGEVCTDYFAMPYGGKTYLAEGPGNPSNTTLPFYIESCFAGKVRFVHVLCSYRKGNKVVQAVDFKENKETLFVCIRKEKTTETIEFPIGFSNEE
jgi:hypothetical protein